MNAPFGTFEVLIILQMVAVAALFIAGMVVLILLIRRLLADERDRKVQRENHRDETAR